MIPSLLRHRAVPVLALLPMLVSGCITRGMDMPLGFRMMAEVYLGFGMLASAIAPANPDAPEGMRAETFADLGGTTAVGLTVDARRDVYVAASDRQRAGASDNRTKPYWLIDDLAAETVEDRRAYIEKWAERGRDPLSWYTQNADRVLRLRDEDGDGNAERSDELASFNDVLTGIGASLLVDERTGNVWFSDVPDLYRLRDADDDGVAEEVEIAAHGFGVTTSLSGHDLHGLTWGPDGRIYFSMGDRGYNVVTREGGHLRPPMVVSRGAVFRMWPDGSELEVFATGLRNPQDLAFDEFGNLFTGENNGDGADEARLVHVVEGGDSGWAMPVQTMEGDYFHGPWEAERLWEMQHEGQPAWVVPPIGYIARGPAGIAFDPGLGGLPAEFREQLLICDYQYGRGRSGIYAYAIEPRGAGFALAGQTPVFKNLLPTDLAFGPDGWIYVSEFDQFGVESRVLRFADPEHVGDPVVQALGTLLREGFDHRSEHELVALLSHRDARARRGAQFALARRGASASLLAVARAERASLLARVHALWGLGQLAPEAVRAAGLSDLAWMRGAPAEVRVAALKLVGELRAEWLKPELRAALQQDSEPRAQATAATALARVGAAEDIAPLLELVRRNDDRDVFLRHAAVYAVASIGSLDRTLAWADDPSSAVRRAVLLVLRRHQDARIERYLSDPDPSLVVEAARAIYDLPIADALPTLAAMAGKQLPLADPDDRQGTQALHRRVIAANLAVGAAGNAEALVAHVLAPETPEPMRDAALDALAGFVEPGPREPVFGFYRGWAARPPEVIHAAIDRLVPAVAGTEREARALDIALAAGRVPLPDDALMARLTGWFEQESVQLASLRVLAERRSPRLDQALDVALRSRSAGLRAEARDVLARVRPAEATERVLALSRRASLHERQRGYATLAAAATPAADARLRRDLASLRAGTLDPSVALDLLLAARARGAALADAVAEYERSVPARDAVAARQVALKGGDAERGARVFEGAGDCVRCHATGRGGHGGGRAGPDLAGVGSRGDRRFLLESVIDPQARIADGFGTVSVVLRSGESLTGSLIDRSDAAMVLEIGGDRRVIASEEIANSAGPTSGMPPMGLTLSLRQLRDLIEYLDAL